jgi:hypothetical protein
MKHKILQGTVMPGITKKEAVPFDTASSLNISGSLIWLTHSVEGYFLAEAYFSLQGKENQRGREYPETN